eukprot:131818-Pelagomonas_calceolata.AAC.8
MLCCMDVISVNSKAGAIVEVAGLQNGNKTIIPPSANPLPPAGAGQSHNIPSSQLRSLHLSLRYHTCTRQNFALRETTQVAIKGWEAVKLRGPCLGGPLTLKMA